MRRAARANPALRTRRDGMRRGARPRRRSPRCPTVERVIGGAPLAAIAAALGIDAALAGARRRARRRRARAAAHPGRLRRALHLLRDDARARGGAVAAAGGARRRGGAARGASCGDRAHRNSHRAATARTSASIARRAPRDARARACRAVRFRLSSVEATEVDERLAELLTGDARRVAPWLHAPLQSGSDRVLRRMGRHWYTAPRYAARASSASRRERRTFGLGADVIAGFPGETGGGPRGDDGARRVAAVHVPARLSVLRAAGDRGRATAGAGCRVRRRSSAPPSCARSGSEKAAAHRRRAGGRRRRSRRARRRRRRARASPRTTSRSRCANPRPRAARAWRRASSSTPAALFARAESH